MLHSIYYNFIVQAFQTNMSVLANWEQHEKLNMRSWQQELIFTND